MDWLTFINDFVGFINDLPDKSDSYWERLIYWIIITYLEAKVYMITFAYEIAGGIVENLGISSVINSAFSALPNAFKSVISYLRIPEAVNMLISAYVTRFVLDLVPL